MHKKLQEILTKKREALKKRKKSSKAFIRALKNPKKGSIAIIAEIKLASPTEKFLGKPDDIQRRAREYELAKVDCISIVTEKHFFAGDPKYVKEIKDVVSLPVLQKDFILDPDQVYEAKNGYADAVLLIAKILSKEGLIKLVNLAIEIGIEPVVEINSEDDLKKAQASKTRIIAVNARDLDTFEISIHKACELLRIVPTSYIKLGFSGISQKSDVEKYKRNGAKAVLIGTSLMKTENIKEFIDRIRV